MNDKEKILQDVGYKKKIKKKEITKEINPTKKTIESPYRKEIFEEPNSMKKNSIYYWEDKKKYGR